jgi:hypothetical protein
MVEQMHGLYVFEAERGGPLRAPRPNDPYRIRSLRSHPARH